MTNRAAIFVLLNGIRISQKNRIGFEDLENERIELLSMDYFLDGDEIDQRGAVGKVTTQKNIT